MPRARPPIRPSSRPAASRPPNSPRLLAVGTTQAPQTHEVDVQRYDVEYRAQVNREHKNDVSAILRSAGRAGQQRGHAAERAAEEQRRKMAAWYATYSASAGKIRLAVNSLVQRYRGNKGGDVVPACTRLATDIPGMLDNPALCLLDPDVKRSCGTLPHPRHLCTGCLAAAFRDPLPVSQNERRLAERLVLLKPSARSPRATMEGVAGPAGPLTQFVGQRTQGRQELARRREPRDSVQSRPPGAPTGAAGFTLRRPAAIMIGW